MDKDKRERLLKQAEEDLVEITRSTEWLVGDLAVSCRGFFELIEKKRALEFTICGLKKEELDVK